MKKRGGANISQCDKTNIRKKSVDIVDIERFQVSIILAN